MDRIDVRRYIEENRVRVTYGRRIPPRRERVRRHPRSPDHYATLSSMLDNRWRLWLSHGKVEILGPRHYRIHLTPRPKEGPRDNE